jgi:hypothetical protein
MGDYATILTIADKMKNVDDGILTEIGLKLLENDLSPDLEQIKETITQKPLCRVCCYMCVAYNLIILFMGYVSTLEDATEELKNLSIEANNIGVLFQEMLPNFQKHLTDKYAHIFHDVKVQSFKKPIFGNVHEIPTHPDDIPAGFDPKKLNCPN